MRTVTTLLYTLGACAALLAGSAYVAGPAPFGADGRPAGLTTATVLGTGGAQPAS